MALAKTPLPVASKICAVQGCFETNSNQILAHIGVPVWNRLFEKMQTEIGLGLVLARRERPARRHVDAPSQARSFA
jgi:hypothetical protein